MEKLFLIELRKNVNKYDALQLIKWLKDEEVIQYMNESPSMANSIELVLRNNQELLLTYFLNQRCHFFMIDYLKSPVGFVSVVPRKNNSYEIVIAIGEKEKWGQKLGHYSLIKSIEKIQKEFSGNTIVAKIHRSNVRSIGLFEHLGFKLTNDDEKYFCYQYHCK